jgi:hypothetical protein
MIAVVGKYGGQLCHFGTKVPNLHGKVEAIFTLSFELRFQSSGFCLEGGDGAKVEDKGAGEERGKRRRVVRRMRCRSILSSWLGGW